MSKLGASVELVGALTSHSASATDLDKFINDPEALLHSVYNIDMANLSVAVVENSSGTVNLVLPFYNGLEDIAADMLADDDLEDISGGELGISLAIAFAVTASIGVATAVTVGTAVGVTQQLHGGETVVGELDVKQENSK